MRNDYMFFKIFYYLLIATNCKERWRNLRGCYTRHLKQQLTPGMRIRKPYYLAESMSFIHPFTKTRTHISTAGNEIELKAENIDTINSTLLSDTEAIENDIENSNNSTTTVHKIDESSYQIISKNDNHVIVASTTTPMVTVAAQTTPTVTIATQQKENILKRKLFDSSDAFGASTSTATFSKLQAIEPPFYEIKPISGQDIEADMFFLKSLLPDITLMNQTQKRRLRIQILSLIDNILGEA